MRNLKKALFSLIAFCLMIIGMLYFLQEKLIFLPTKLADHYSYTFRHPFEEFTLTTPDGAKLNALHFKRENPNGIILYFHGNAGNLSRWGEEVQGLVNLNYDLVVMDYRTYGKSTGALSESALLEDAQMFFDYVANLYDKDEIRLYGRSLGTAMASYLASRNSVSMLVLETPFYSLVDIARERFPILPVGLLMKYPFMNHEYLKTANCPIVIVHGDEDRVVPIKSAVKLYRSLEGKDVRFVKVRGGRHNNLASFETYQHLIRTIFQPAAE